MTKTKNDVDDNVTKIFVDMFEHQQRLP